MKLADVSIRRPVFALMMSVALVTLGLFSYRTLGVDLMPRTEQPTVQVRVNLPGASAEEIESTITQPIETALNAIEGHSESTAMIGDRMETDIVAGMEAGLHTILVLTGVTSRQQIERFPYRPSLVVDSVADLVDLVE